ncbi:glycosyltransferase family 2 protein [Kordiimonas lipolytica]|uniref:Glycosyltransferase family 2 protein n=1 Tax=Kordiimonas lipolytica TaxID=1662421 RepID=A0ABV8UFR2_9PROT|nr:glycosyltransferase family 2 protein [Kordiimonas lipolytica]
MDSQTVAIVIPCYNVKRHILEVIDSIGPACQQIFVVDDACPEQSGAFVEANCTDPRVTVLKHAMNQGVGGAVVTGYKAALEAGADIVVKMDGDGQMDPDELPGLIRPLEDGTADYTKGNRFHSFYSVRQMPKVRLFGNAVLSFMTKLSSGYWNLFDPTNGYTAIHREVLSRIELHKLGKRYFFETDMLIMLGDHRAVVTDVPMEAVYGDEESGLKISRIAGPFLWGNIRGTIRRMVYSYFFRDFNLASLNLVFGLLLMAFGGVFGLVKWQQSIAEGVAATSGTVMVAVLPIILGFQLVLFFLSYDVSNTPRQPLQSLSARRRKRPDQA